MIYVLMTKRKKIDAPMFLIYALAEKDDDLLAPAEVVWLGYQSLSN